MYKIFALFLAGLLWGISAHAMDADQRKIKVAQTQLQIFMENQRELDEKQRLLFSLKDPVRPSELDGYAMLYRMKISTIHLCTGAGVGAIFLSEDEPIRTQIDEDAVVKKFGAAHWKINSVIETHSDLVEGNLKLCGFEARLKQVDLKQLLNRLQAGVISVEITDEKRRPMPINRWWLKD